MKSPLPMRQSPSEIELLPVAARVDAKYLDLELHMAIPSDEATTGYIINKILYSEFICFGAICKVGDFWGRSNIDNPHNKCAFLIDSGILPIHIFIIYDGVDWSLVEECNSGFIDAGDRSWRYCGIMHRIQSFKIKLDECVQKWLNNHVA